jgi:DNA repair protein RecO
VPTISDSAVCIRRWDFSETSQTVSFFTREHGVLRGLAKGAKREKGSFGGGIDVLTRGQIVAIVKPGRELATLTQWSLEETCRAVRNDLAANRAGLYMADLIHRFVEQGDAHPHLFDAFVAALRSLEDPSSVERALLQFQWMLLRLVGYQPELRRDVETGQPLPERSPILAFRPPDAGRPGGGLTADTAGDDRWLVRRETVEALRQLDERELAPDLAPELAARANRLLASFIREILGDEPPAMRWAFPDLPAIVDGRTSRRRRSH